MQWAIQWGIPKGKAIVSTTQEGKIQLLESLSIAVIAPLNEVTKAIKINLVGKDRHGKFFALTDSNQYLSFTENDYFQIVRNNNIIRVHSSELNQGDLILMHKVDDI